MLQLENEYKLYGHLKERILRVAEKEMKLKCDIYFEMEEVKIGRRVESIRFIIRKNKNLDDASPLVNLSVEQKSLFDRIIHDFQMSELKLNSIFQKYAIDKIEHAFMDTSERIKSKVIKNPKGYFLSLLADSEYSLHETKEKQRKKQLQMKMDESEKFEQEQAKRELDNKQKVSEWIDGNPVEYERLLKEEELKLG